MIGSGRGGARWIRGRKVSQAQKVKNDTSGSGTKKYLNKKKLKREEKKAKLSSGPRFSMVESLIAPASMCHVSPVAPVIRAAKRASIYTTPPLSPPPE